MDKFRIEINGNESNSCTSFMRELNQYYQLYEREWQNESASWKTFWNQPKSKKTYIKPERISSRSPLTILHGPWGSGKTFFIETLVKEWQDASKGTNFKNIVVIDLWNYIHHTTNIVLEMANQFYGIILNFLPSKFKKKWKRKKFWKMMLADFAASLEQNTKITGKLFRIGKYCYKLFADGKLGNKSNHHQKIEEIVEHLKPTVVFFDNIERLESYSIEIIKVIQFFSFLPNFVFVLPMNKSELKFSASTLSTNREMCSEMIITKYITLGIWFEYKQDYSQLLLKLGFSKRIVPELNRSLTLPKQSETVLSIREVEKLFKQNQHKRVIDLANRDKYAGFYYISQNIWKNNFIEDNVKDFMKCYYAFLNKIIPEEWKIKEISKKILDNLSNTSFVSDVIKKKVTFVLNFNLEYEFDLLINAEDIVLKLENVLMVIIELTKLVLLSDNKENSDENQIREVLNLVRERITNIHYTMTNPPEIIANSHDFSFDDFFWIKNNFLKKAIEESLTKIRLGEIKDKKVYLYEYYSIKTSIEERLISQIKEHARSVINFIGKSK